MEKIILASGSPRRKAILQQLQLPFRVVVPHVDEAGYKATRAKARVRLLAKKKAEDVQLRLPPAEGKWILAVDTMVLWRGKAFGKPSDADEAREMLHCISGRVHRVLSGVALLPAYGQKCDTRVVCSLVKFRKLCQQEIDFYLTTGEWQGAAGGYRIQERAAFYIEWIKGSYSNIVGLPISDFYGMLWKNNYSFEG